MLLKSKDQIPGSEVTDRALWLDRRRFLALGAAGALFGRAFPAGAATLSGVVKSPWRVDEATTPKKDVTSYNNFYEFGTGKDDPAQLAPSFFGSSPKPWTVAVSGECAKPGAVAYEDLIRPHQMEERIYRMRCVEAWSMVIPWVGVPLAEVLKRFEPTSRAKYVEFKTLVDPARFPGQRRGVLDWPYIEGLRIDEAMHPLALLAVGLYGEELLPQNGAPIRLVVPWKYGFKGIKSIVSIRFTETPPKTSWMVAGPREYGFYANVNPKVDHPRWSQAKERRIGEFLKRDTLAFNGYAEQVAGRYAGMDLAVNY